MRYHCICNNPQYYKNIQLAIVIMYHHNDIQDSLIYSRYSSMWHHLHTMLPLLRSSTLFLFIYSQSPRNCIIPHQGYGFEGYNPYTFLGWPYTANLYYDTTTQTYLCSWVLSLRCMRFLDYICQGFFALLPLKYGFVIVQIITTLGSRHIMLAPSQQHAHSTK